MDMDGARHEQAVAMLTSLERYMRLVCEREVIVPKGSAVLKASPLVGKPVAVPTVPKPLPRKLNSTSSVSSESGEPQVSQLLAAV